MFIIFSIDGLRSSISKLTLEPESKQTLFLISKHPRTCWVSKYSPATFTVIFIVFIIFWRFSLNWCSSRCTGWFTSRQTSGRTSGRKSGRTSRWTSRQTSRRSSRRSSGRHGGRTSGRTSRRTSRFASRFTSWLPSRRSCGCSCNGSCCGGPSSDGRLRIRIGSHLQSHGSHDDGKNDEMRVARHDVT